MHLLSSILSLLSPQQGPDLQMHDGGKIKIFAFLATLFSSHARKALLALTRATATIFFFLFEHVQ
jgi:hypothetical protein